MPDKIKIAIIGTRGIPNNYGGFEQFAEYLSQGLTQQGFDVAVYNSHNHPYQEKDWNGVNIIHRKDPEHRLGTVGQFIYDFNCIHDARKRNFDIILQLGYTSSSVWGFLLPKRALIITNMDGLEWKRTKFSKPVQSFLQWAEKLAVKTSDFLIADSIGIQQYLTEKYQVPSEYIPYGAHVFEKPDMAVPAQYDMQAYQYDMLIARLEPENNIEVILDGVAASDMQRPFLVIGNHQTAYGSYLCTKFAGQKNIHFLGSIYNMEVLNNLRYYSNIYFHGHSVGGTNPSLLEAMASEAFICANNNVFNAAILGDDAAYFSNAVEVTAILTSIKKDADEVQKKVKNNVEKIKSTYSWKRINQQYLDFMSHCYRAKNSGASNNAF